MAGQETSSRALIKRTETRSHLQTGPTPFQMAIIVVLGTQTNPHRQPSFAHLRHDLQKSVYSCHLHTLATCLISYALRTCEITYFEHLQSLSLIYPTCLHPKRDDRVKMQEWGWCFMYRQLCHTHTCCCYNSLFSLA